MQECIRFLNLSYEMAMHWIKVLVNTFRIELVVFLSFMALSSIYVSEHTILYDTVCHQALDHTNAREGCDLTDNDFIRKRVQAASTSWTTILSVTYAIPAIIGESILGAWSDQYGRKDCLILALAAVITTTVPDAVLTYYVRAPIYTLIASTAVSGVSGSGSTIMSLSLAFISDKVNDKKRLTYRMTTLFVCRSLGAVAGAFMLGSLRPYWSFAKNILLAQAILIVAFLYTMFKMPLHVPKHGHSLFLLGQTKKDKNGTSGATTKFCVPPNVEMVHPRKINFCKIVIGLLRYIWESNVATWRTLTRRRRRHKRLYLVIITIIYFSYVMSEFSLLNGPVFSFYAFDRPFYWGPTQLSRYRGAQNLSTLVGNVLGLLLIQKLHVFTDTMLIILALISGFAYLLIVGLAESSWVLYVGATLGVFNSLIIPATKSFLTQQVAGDEVGKVLALNSVTAEVAFAVTRLVFTNIYAATVNGPITGFVFLLGAAGIALSMAPSLWIHLHWARRRMRTVNLMVKGVVAKCGVISSVSRETKCFL